MMQREYERYLLAKNIRKLYPLNYETDNIIERFLLLHALNNKNIYDILVKQLKEKKIKYKKTAIADTKELIKKFNNLTTTKSNIKPEIYDAAVVYGEFKRRIGSDRMKLLLKKHPNKNHLVKMLLRYGSILPGGQQWAISYSDHYNNGRNSQKKYYESGNVILEAFASPLNSQAIQHNIPFGSLFKDVDGVYGSVGNIFDLDFKKFMKSNFIIINNKIINDNKMKIIMANPPYIEEIMNKFADLVIKLKKQYNIKFIIWVPTWKDSYFYKLLSKGTVIDYDKNKIALDIQLKSGKSITIPNKFYITNIIY